MVLVVEHIEHGSESFRLLAWSKDICAIDVVGPQNNRRRIRGFGDLWHVHGNVELTLLEHGSGTRGVGDSNLPMRESELVMIGPHVPHCWNCSTDSSGLSLQFSIESGNPLRALPEWESLAELMEHSARGLIFSPETAAKVGKLLQRMTGEGRLARLASFIEVLATLDRRHCQPLSAKSFGASDTTTEYPEIQKVVLEILRRFPEDIGLMDMVAITRLSRATFCREFKNYTDRTFVQFLNEVRINAVRRQLLRTNTPISDIAFAAGFENLSHFNRVFRRFTGISPREFRNRFAITQGIQTSVGILPLQPATAIGGKLPIQHIPGM